MMIMFDIQKSILRSASIDELEQSCLATKKFIVVIASSWTATPYVEQSEQELQEISIAKTFFY